MSPADEVVSGAVAITHADLTRGVRDAVMLYRARWLCLGLFVALMVAAGVTGSMVWSVKNVLPLVGASVFYVFLFVGPHLTGRRLYRALIKGGDNQVMYRFDAEGVTIRASAVTTTFAYRLLSRFRETRSMFLLTTNSGMTTIVPKRAFAASDLQRVRGLIPVEVKREAGRGLARPVKFFVLWLALIIAFVVVWQLLNARPR